MDQPPLLCLAKWKEKAWGPIYVDQLYGHQGIVRLISSMMTVSLILFELKRILCKGLLVVYNTPLDPTSVGPTLCEGSLYTTYYTKYLFFLNRVVFCLWGRRTSYNVHLKKYKLRVRFSMIVLGPPSGPLSLIINQYLWDERP